MPRLSTTKEEKVRRFPAGAAATVSSLLLLAAPAAAGERLHASTTAHGLTVTSTLSAPEGTSGQWYVALHDASVSPQPLLAKSAIARYPQTKTESVTLPAGAFGSACSLVVQVDVRFGGTTHRDTKLVPGGIRRLTLHKANCTSKPPTVQPPTVKPPTVKPPTVKPPTVKPPTVKPPTGTVKPPVQVKTTPPSGVSGVSEAAPAPAVEASVTFTG